MALDKMIAVIFLLISVIYGYASYTYPLLPFERNMVFLPNTMPMVLAMFGALLAILIIILPKAEEEKEDAEQGEITVVRWQEYEVTQALTLIGAMILYALALRPIGFLAATTLFLFGAGWILGERRAIPMIVTALSGALIVWLLVQEVLGVFLKPYPWFIS